MFHKLKLLLGTLLTGLDQNRYFCKKLFTIAFKFNIKRLTTPSKIVPKAMKYSNHGSLLPLF